MEEKLEILYRAAKSGDLEGVGAYEIGVCGKPEIMKVFLGFFADKLVMKYPCVNFSGTSVTDSDKVGIKIIAIIDSNGNVKSTVYTDVITYVMDIIGARVWSSGTCIAMGRR